MLFSILKSTVIKSTTYLSSNYKNRNNTMSNASDNKSDVQQAANTANADKIEKNLQQDNDSKKPEDLAENEKTPFIDEQTRTDK